MAQIDTKELFDRARELAEQKREVMDEQLAVRETLRNLDQAGMLDEAESKLLNEVFPVRTREKGTQTKDDGKPESAPRKAASK